MRYLFSILLICISGKIFCQLSAPKITDAERYTIDGGSFYKSMDANGYYYLPSELSLETNDEDEPMLLFMMTNYGAKLSLTINAHLSLAPNITKDSIKRLIPDSNYFGSYPMNMKYQKSENSQEVKAWLRYIVGKDTLSEEIGQLVTTNDKIILSHKIEGEQVLNISKIDLNNVQSYIGLELSLPVDLILAGKDSIYDFSKEKLENTCKLIPAEGFDAFHRQVIRLIESNYKNLNNSTKEILQDLIRGYCLNGGLNTFSSISSSSTSITTIDAKGNTTKSETETTNDVKNQDISQIITFKVSNKKARVTSKSSTISLIQIIKNQ